MKAARYWILAAVLVGLFGLVAYMKQRFSSRPTLQVYSWSNYFSETLLRRFNQATGIDVEVSYFSSNEELFAKMVAGASGYDVIVPSDYMVSRMIARGMLLPLEPKQIPNVRLVDDFYRNLPYDRGLKYSVPYGQGYTGILINTEKVNVPGAEVSWSILLNTPDPKYTSFLDDVREVFAMGLMSQGLPAASHSQEHFTRVKPVLQRAKKQIALFTSEPVPLLLKGELHIAHAFSTHASQVEAESKAFRFYFPTEGAVAWTDNFAIPRGARHVEEAHQFINFFLEPRQAARTSESSGLATPVRAALEFLPLELRSNRNLYPDKKVQDRLHFLDDLTGEDLMLINRLWTEMKSG